jgi:hypothetical protein
MIWSKDRRNEVDARVKTLPEAPDSESSQPNSMNFLVMVYSTSLSKIF